MTMLDTTTNIIPWPAALDTLAAGIRADLERTAKGRREWIEGTLGLAAKLKEARGKFTADLEFSAWIKANTIDINHQDRAALINMADNLDLAREILNKTERLSWQHIWNKEMSYRFTHVSKPIQGDTGSNSVSISEAIKNSPGVPIRVLAERLGISIGKVQRTRAKLAAEALGKKTVNPELPLRRPPPPPPPRKVPTLAEQMAIRNQRPRFDDMTREERGMGSKEYGAEQHPDYPEGWTRDVVHRELYGRIQLFPPDVIAQRELMRRFSDTINRLADLAEKAPEAEAFDQIANREGLTLYLRKLAPHIEKLRCLLDKFA